MAKKETKTGKENSKNKKSFWKGFKAELKKVVWPTPKQLMNNTVAVLSIVLLTALIVFALDLTFEAMNKYGVGKLKEIVSTTNSVSENNTTENTNNENATENQETENNAENNVQDSQNEQTNNAE